MAQAPTSIGATLRHRPFHALLGGGTVYFIGNAMQAMAAAWLIVEVSGSSFPAALVQTAVFLPMFLLSLPGGVLADTTDRRRLILAALVLQAVLVALVALLFLLGGVVFAAVMAVAALSHSRPLTYLALMAGGGSWLSVMSTYNTATQTSVPPWVRARATALHTLCALGALAIGGAFWGALSDIVGLTPALLAGTAAMIATLLLARPFPLRMSELQEVTQVPLSQDLFVAHQPAPEAGPVAVEIAYRIRPEQTSAFLDDVSQLRGPRKRDGATFWRVYRDLSDPSRYVERFIVTSWADYLHQRARGTLADLQLEERLREHLLPGEAPGTQHYIAEL